MSDGNSNGKHKSVFGKTFGAVGSVAGSTLGAVGNVAGTTIGAATNVAGKAIEIGTLGAVSTERPPPPPDPLWDMHRDPPPMPAGYTAHVEKKKERRKRLNAGAWVDDLAEEFDDDDFRDRTTFLETYLKDKFYGDWYHNAAIIFVTAFFSWLVARFGGGLIWLTIICAFTSTYYRTSILRVRRNVRDDLARESAMTKLETDAETMEWLNSFVVKFWAIYLPTLNAMVIDTTNQVLSGTATPTPIDGLELKRFTLGTKPPRIDLVRTYPKTEEDIIVMDWGFSFTPNDIEDLTSRQLKDKVNPLVELAVRIGKGVISTGMPVLVQDMAFKGLIQVKIKLITSFPHIQTASVSFLRPPYFDFVLKPIGGETLGFDINFIPGLEGFIKGMVHDNLGPMFYDPNAFTVNVQQMLAGGPNDAANGVLAVTIYNTRNLKGSDSIGNTVDPYVKLTFGGDKELARTSTKFDTNTPKWNETKLILVSSLSEALNLNVLDFNDMRKDKPIGTVTFPLEQLQSEPEMENVVGKIVQNGKERGDLIFDARYFPVQTGKKLEDGTIEPPPQLNTGILRFTVHQCKELDQAARKAFGASGFNPFAVYYVDGKEVHTTKLMKRTTTPIWDEAHEVLVTNKIATTLTIVIRTDKELSGSADIASYKVKLSDLLAENEKGNDWFRMNPGGRIRMTAQWKPVAMAGISGSGGYIPPIGVLRFHVKKAVDLRNLETVGKVDPYVRAMVNNYHKSQTITIYGELNPEWDEVIYATITGPNEKISLEVMDAESTGKDRLLGEAALDASKLIQKNEKGEYVTFDDNAERTALLTMPGRAPKGQLLYTASFFPSVSIMDPDDIAEEERIKKEAEEKEAAMTPEEKKKRDDEEKKKADAKAKADKEAAKKAGANGATPPVPAPIVEEPKSQEPEKLRLGIEELVQYQSGLLVFKIMSGTFSKPDVYIQVFFDDQLYPSYVTGRSHGRKSKFEEVGDGLIRELEFSKITIRAVTKDTAKRSDTDDVIAEFTGSTLARLKQGYNKAVSIPLAAVSGDVGGANSVEFLFKYVPVKMVLSPIETFDNQGILMITMVDGTSLPAADRRGKSDPYCVLELNGEKVFKTKVIKKTLNPTWNESFQMPVSSRISAKLELKVYDWDMGPADDDFLGGSLIDIAKLQPMNSEQQILTLDGASGQVRVSLQFRPDYIVKAIKGTAALSGTLAVPGMVVAAPIKGVGFAAGGVVKGASFLRHGFKSKEKRAGATADDGASILTTSTSRRSRF
ncbi:C2 domain-containing protein [Limtongia smithiae]|uniref:C2 domain-containing protein n=1 Tax=Limtongia smithiae TaxID=1125753 RepID=UPI0034CF2370